MKTSHLNPDKHIGFQPIRVLKWNLAHRLEHLHPEVPAQFHALVQKHRLQPCINYDCTEAPIFDPIAGNHLIPFVDAAKQITIQETFLSMVWAMCYSHLVLFEEHNSKRILNQIHGRNDPINHRAVRGAADLYRYGVSLVRTYTPWDKNTLPNPEYYDPEDSYTGKANNAFVLAMVFILWHEFAHIDLGHQDGYMPRADRILAESDADQRATQILLSGPTDDSTKLNNGVGMLLGFCSLLTLQRELPSNTHPHLAERIERVLRTQKLDDASQLWGIATMSFQLWDDLHNKANPRIQWPQGARTFKDVFYHILAQLR